MDVFTAFADTLYARSSDPEEVEDQISYVASNIGAI